MTGSFSIDFDWSDRKETAVVCAARASRFLHNLTTLSKCFANLRSIRDEVSSGVYSSECLDANELKSLFEAGVSRRGLDNSVVDDLGFSVALANSDQSIAIRMHCGVYCGVVPNVCTIEILKLTSRTTRFMSNANLKRVFQAAVDAWNPERGLLTSMKLWKAVPQSKSVPNFGWVTYLSRDYPIPDAVRARFRVEEISGAGNLIFAIAEEASVIGNDNASSVREVVTAFGYG